MAWVRIDDHFDEHPKMARVGPLGWGVWLAGLAYCNRNLTDGFIPWEKSRTLVSFEIVEDDGLVSRLARHSNAVTNADVTSGMPGDDLDMPWVIGLLTRCGLWDVVRAGDRISGYRIHDYEDYQPSRDQVLAERARTAKRQTVFRKRHAKNNDHSNAVTNAVVTPLVTPLVTQMSRWPRTQTQDIKEKENSPDGEQKKSSAPSQLRALVVGFESAIDRLEAAATQPSTWQAALFGLYGPNGTDRGVWKGVGPEEEAGLLAKAIDRLAGESQRYNGRFFRSILQTVIDERTNNGRSRVYREGGKAQARAADQASRRRKGFGSD